MRYWYVLQLAYTVFGVASALPQTNHLFTRKSADLGGLLDGPNTHGAANFDGEATDADEITNSEEASNPDEEYSFAPTDDSPMELSVPSGSYEAIIKFFLQSNSEPEHQPEILSHNFNQLILAIDAEMAGHHQSSRNRFGFNQANRNHNAHWVNGGTEVTPKYWEFHPSDNAVAFLYSIPDDENPTPTVGIPWSAVLAGVHALQARWKSQVAGSVSITAPDGESVELLCAGFALDETVTPRKEQEDTHWAMEAAAMAGRTMLSCGGQENSDDTREDRESGCSIMR